MPDSSATTARLPPVIFTLATTLALATPAHVSLAQTDAPSARRLQALRSTGDEIELDGRLSEEVWRRAPVATGFTQREPEDGQPASERTEVRVLYTPDVIYVGVRALDSDPSGIRSELVRRDRGAESDEIAIFFDSYHDRRTAFGFYVTPAGSIRDVYLFNDSPHQGDDSWDPVWQVKTSLDSLGWCAEFRIPLTQLRFDRGRTTWGLQVRRRIHRKAEHDYWAPFSKEASGFASLFGELQGLEGLAQPMRLEVRPYTVVTNRHRPPSTGTLYAPRDQSELNAGFDLQYGVTSDFTLDLTVNPDFGQVEADPAVVNLTAFETFFPEKRPFFVEGSGLFDRWLPGGRMFYSRRIGRRPQGGSDPPDGGTVEIPDASTIISAAKLTGKTSSGLGLGLLSAFTTRERATLRDSTGAVVGSENVAPFTHHFASRAEQDFKAGSHTVGAMLTAVNRKLDANLEALRSAAYVGELDGTHRWKENSYAVRWQIAASHVRGGPEAIASTQRSPFRYFQRPDASHVELDTTRTHLSGYALALSGGKEAGSWRYGAAYERVSPGFEINDMGFQHFADRQFVEGWAGYLQSQPRWIFRDFRISSAANRWWLTSGEVHSNWFRPIYFEATLKNNWSIGFNPIAVGSEPLSPSALRGGPGLREDGWHNSFVWIDTDSRKPIAFSLWAEVGGNFGTDGRWYELEPELSFRPTPLLNGSLGVEYSWGRNPAQWVGALSADDSTHYVLAELEQKTLELVLRLDWSFTPTLSLQFYGQPFVSAGSYSEFKEVTRPRAREFADRFRFYGEELSCGEDLTCEVDLDLDGTADLSFDDPDFNSRQLRSTLVLRWEYRPGSVLFFAWQHGRDDYLRESRFGGLNDLTDLFGRRPDNTFLFKANYWVAF